jgi:hypothetical protein
MHLPKSIILLVRHPSSFELPTSTCYGSGSSMRLQLFKPLVQSYTAKAVEQFSPLLGIITSRSLVTAGDLVHYSLNSRRVRLPTALRVDASVTGPRTLD